MTQNDFYKLFAETGEPIYWLLSREAAQPETAAKKPEMTQQPPSASAE